MNPPDFCTVLYATVAAIRDGEVNEADVSYEVSDGDRLETLTVTVRRVEFDHAATVAEDGVVVEEES